MPATQQQSSGRAKRGVMATVHAPEASAPYAVTTGSNGRPPTPVHPRIALKRHCRPRAIVRKRPTDRDRNEAGDCHQYSGQLHDLESNRDAGGYPHGGYAEAGFGPRGTRRYGDQGRRGRERTERGPYSSERPRDYAGNHWNRTYGAQRYWHDDQRYGEREDKD